ncbi:hypothetical protein BVRB_7g179690 [Beta vulgaris subsp. vulgaris]|uniref:Uncharacterized protein n=1 Tax=Beta vulgaris subsp. vulgaris TaxID=3555 RepID=A0A0J8BAR1_BETVV|nr:hypothetical protein BVRB_7g179690 [Beta vulgaris subsp. vulgaris]
MGIHSSHPHLQNSHPPLPPPSPPIHVIPSTPPSQPPNVPPSPQVNEATVLDMTSKLCEKLLNVKEHRNAASIALKTIVSDINSLSVVQALLDSLVPLLTTGIICSRRWRLRQGTGSGGSSGVACRGCRGRSRGCEGEVLAGGVTASWWF